MTCNPLSALPENALITIVGVGLMGGSLALALQAKGHRLLAVTLQPEAMPKRVRQAFTECYSSIGLTVDSMPEPLMQSHVVVLATPVTAIIEQMPLWQKYLARGGVLTDMGSIKGRIIEASHLLGSEASRFVGAHPMAGKEFSSADYASADLFEQCTVILTPQEHTDANAVAVVHALWSQLTSKLLYLRPDAHDQAVAWVSHLPHLLAYAFLMELNLPDQQTNWQAAGRGFADFTRIGGSSPQLWLDIFRHNPQAIAEALQRMQVRLEQWQNLLQQWQADADDSLFLNQATADEWLQQLQEVSQKRRNWNLDAEPATPPQRNLKG